MAANPMSCRRSRLMKKYNIPPSASAASPSVSGDGANATIHTVAVVPTFTSIFDSYGAELPGVTKALIAISDFFSNNIIVIIVVLFVLIAGYKIYGKTQSGKLNIAKLKLKLPVLGNIQALTGASEFAKTMTTMMAA